MKKTNCIIIDKSSASRKIIEQYIETIEYLRLTHSLSDHNRALDILEKDLSIGLVFVDVAMKGIRTSTFLNHLKSSHLVIITTDKKEYALIKIEGLDEYNAKAHEACYP